MPIFVLETLYRIDKLIISVIPFLLWGWDTNGTFEKQRLYIEYDKYMKLTFIRHASLIPPYNDYELLDYNLLAGLSRREINP